MLTKESLKCQKANLTYQQIGETLGISRQRVQQLIAPSNIEREQIIAEAEGKCQKCGIYVGKAGHIHHVDYEGNITEYLCNSCHSRGQYPPKIETKPLSPCKQCGMATTNKAFCSHKCLGKYNGKHYGFKWRQLKKIREAAWSK